MTDRNNKSSKGTSDLEQCRERALKLLSQRPHTVKQLRTKLLKKDFPRAMVEEIIKDFIRVGLLNDRQVAMDYCSFMKGASPPVGRNRVRTKLYQYGISPEIIAETLETRWDMDGDEGELQRATDAAGRKLRLIRDRSDPRKVREKLYRFLANKGFAGNICSQAVEEALSDSD